MNDKIKRICASVPGTLFKVPTGIKQILEILPNTDWSTSKDNRSFNLFGHIRFQKFGCECHLCNGQTSQSSQNGHFGQRSQAENKISQKILCIKCNPPKDYWTNLYYQRSSAAGIAVGVGDVLGPYVLHELNQELDQNPNQFIILDSNNLQYIFETEKQRRFRNSQSSLTQDPVLMSVYDV